MHHALVFPGQNELGFTNTWMTSLLGGNRYVLSGMQKQMNFAIGQNGTSFLFEKRNALMKNDGDSEDR